MAGYGTSVNELNVPTGEHLGRYLKICIQNDIVFNHNHSLAGQETDEDATLQRPSKREREEFYKRIADRLAQIGDRFVTDYQEGGNGGEPGGPVVSEKVKELAASAAVVEMSTRGGATGSGNGLLQPVNSRFL